MNENQQYYGVYEQLLSTGKILIHTSELNRETVVKHFDWILNIMRDYVETEEFRSMQVEVIFDTHKVSCVLRIPDYYLNLIMWHMPCMIGKPILPCHIFFEDNVTRSSIKKYIDKYFVYPYRQFYNNIEMNNIIDDVLYKFVFINEFALYLCNTVNLEDYIELMNTNPRFEELMNTDLSSYPLDEIARVSLNLTNEVVDIIKDSNHCLRDSLRTGEATNIKQFKEIAISIASKPDGTGGVFPNIINHSYLNGGLDNPLYYFIESSAGRVAQILSKVNVGTSGYFARLIGLNNQETNLHRDPNYVCGSRNFTQLYISSERFLERFIGSYYRLTEDGIEMKINVNDTHLVGQTILLRSAITCESHARGEGICYRCYGDISYSNVDIAIGKYAAEVLSSNLTQKLLSAKHLLEAKIKKLKWAQHVEKYIVFDGNIVSLRDDINTDPIICIDTNMICQETEYDEKEFNDFITEFSIIDEGMNIPIFTTDADKLYFTQDLLSIIGKCRPDEDGIVHINYSTLADTNLFLMEIYNDELTKTLERVKDILDKNAVTTSMDRNTILQELIQECMNGGLDIMGTHCALLISNQIRSLDDNMENVDWKVRYPHHQILTLKQALTNHPSITTRLSFEKISKLLINPSTYKCRKPSFMDLFFMERPQLYVKGLLEDSDRKIDTSVLVDAVRIRNIR